MKCAKCGAELKPGTRFCGKCGSMAETFKKTDLHHTVSAWKKVNRMPQGIALGTEERIVRQYRIGRYTFRTGFIDVIITNKRVIRFEESTWLGMQNNHIDEINIDAVYGTSTSMMRSASVLGMIAALALLAFGIACLAGGLFPKSGMTWMNILFGILGIGLAAVIIANSFRPTMVFRLHGTIGNGALQTVVNARGRMFGRNDASIFFQFKPTPDTTVMLKEIGACVYDLKTQGDKAIEKWRTEAA